MTLSRLASCLVLVGACAHSSPKSAAPDMAPAAAAPEAATPTETAPETPAAEATPAAAAVPAAAPAPAADAAPPAKPTTRAPVQKKKGNARDADPDSGGE